MRDDRLTAIEWDAIRLPSDSVLHSRKFPDGSRVEITADELVELARLAQRTKAAEDEAAWLKEPC